VIDAAYSEYVQRNDYESGIELVATSDNVVMTRPSRRSTGSLPVRLGWMYGPAHVVDAIKPHPRTVQRQRAAIAAGIAAIEDAGHQERSRAHNSQWLAWLMDEVGKLGLKVTPSVANFILIHSPSRRARQPPTPMPF